MRSIKWALLDNYLTNLLAVDGELGAEQRRRGAGGPQGQVAEEGPVPPLAPAPVKQGGEGAVNIDACYAVFNHHLHQRMPQCHQSINKLCNISRYICIQIISNNINQNGITFLDVHEMNKLKNLTFLPHNIVWFFTPGILFLPPGPLWAGHRRATNTATPRTCLLLSGWEIARGRDVESRQ